MSEQYRENKREEQRTRSFNPNEHLMQIKSSQGSRDYLPVQWRLVWFRSACPEGTIETEMVHLDLDRETEEEGYAWNAERKRSEKVTRRANGFAIFRAVVKDGKGGSATGTKSESAASFPDYIEKAETGAIGRALAALGYGTQFTGDEFSEGHRIVDSPVERGAQAVEGGTYGNGRQPIVTVRPSVASNNGKANATNGNSQQASTADLAPDLAATEQQLASIRKLCEHLGRPEPEHADAISYVSAKELITQLSQEYRQSRSKAS